MKRTLCILLAMMTLLCCFVSCSEKVDENTDETTMVSMSETTAPANGETDLTETTVPEISDNIPDTLKFGGRTIEFLVWGDVENPEFEVKEQSGDLVLDAIYFRNKTVEERLGVKLNFTESPGSNVNRSAFVAVASNSILAGDPLDVIAAYSLTATDIVNKGLTRKLNELDNLDFSMPWWPEKLMEEATVKGNIYFCSGDISTNMLHKMHAIFFDKKVCEQYGYIEDDLYKTALDGKWTLDKWFEMGANVYEDLNNNGEKDYEDRFGLTLDTNYFDVLFYASGLRTTDKDNDGNIVVSELFGGEKAAGLAKKIGEYFDNNPGPIYTDNKFTEGRKMMNKEVMMILTRCDVAGKNLRTVEDLEYGVLPAPKYDEQQEKYISCLAFPCTLYEVPTSCNKNLDAVGAVLEVMGSEGYKQITPALFETTMKVKYANDDVTSQIYDIIRKSVTFDIGRMCASSLGDVSYKFFREQCMKSASTFASSFKAGKKVMEKAIDKFMKNVAG